jgi:hypothetical protein
VPVAAEGDTVAVSVTLPPEVTEVEEGVRVVVVEVVEDEVTVTVMAFEVLDEYAVEPP